METFRTIVIDEYTQDTLDVWAYDFEISKQRFWKVYLDITLSTIILPDLLKKAFFHGVITSVQEDEGQDGSDSDGLGATKEGTSIEYEGSDQQVTTLCSSNCSSYHSVCT